MIYFLLRCLSQVKALKEKIENEKGKDGFPVAGQKLIYAGTSSLSLHVIRCNCVACLDGCFQLIRMRLWVMHMIRPHRFFSIIM